jgi:cytochrome c oxidase assembly protein subunit 15
LARGFVLLAATTYCLIVLGALVRANGAGLACPDWPLCFGQLVPQFDFRVALEWGHRVLAGLVSLGLLALSWAGWRREELRSRLKPRLAMAWALLATQVVSGGLTVLLGLAPWTVSAHLLLGNAFCLTLLGPALVAVTATCLLLQLVLGGLVAGHAAGLACPTFPTCDGHSLAPTLGGSVGLQVLHRVHGLLLLASFALLAWVTRRSGRVGRLARTGLRLVLVQIAIGVANVLLQLPVEVTALHTATAAAIVLATALLARELVLARGGPSAGGLAREAR